MQMRASLNMIKFDLSLLFFKNDIVYSYQTQEVPK